MFFYMMDKKVKIMLSISLILVILAGIYFLVNPETKEEEKNTGVTIVEKPTDNSTLTPPVVDDNRESQSDALKKYKMIITKVIDKGNVIEYLATVGLGEAVQETQVIVNQNTIFYDAVRQKNSGPNIVIEGMEVVFIGTGNPQIKDLVAEVIIVGGNPNIKYSKIKSVNIDGDTGGFIFELGLNSEFLAIPKDMVLRNAIADTVVTDTRTITEGAAIIYNVKPEFTQESFGLLYEAEEVIVVYKP